MTIDDFKQKCDEIHRIVCYLLDDDSILIIFRIIGNNHHCFINNYRFDKPFITKDALHYAILLADRAKNNV